MSSRKVPSTPPPLEPPVLKLDEIERGVAKLKRRLEELKVLGPAKVSYNDQRVENAERNIRATILEVFGPNSPQYRDNEYVAIWHGGRNVYDSENDCQRKFEEGIPQTVALLENLVANLEEQRIDQSQDPATRVRNAFSNLDLHSRIKDVAEDLYNSGHYRNAVLDSAVALVNFVKEKSRRHDLDGAGLMRTVFSRNGPVLAFNDLKDQSDCDEQEGLMHLFEGAVLAFRNPRAHDLSPDTPEYAVECIGFLSMLAKRLDTAKRR